jgi:hypothetical protein
VSDRLVQWFYGVPNMVGIVLALGGLALFIAGVISGVLVVPIVGGLYAIGALVTPRPRALSVVDVGGQLDPARLQRGLDQIAEQAQKRLPVELAAKVAAIRTTILDLLPNLKTTSIPRDDLFAIERTVSDYLPTTLDAYLTLPRAYAKTKVVKDGKTAEQLLAGQLDLIDEKMEAISEAVAKDDVGKLLAQGRFLEERFSQPSDELAIPGKPA